MRERRVRGGAAALLAALAALAGAPPARAQETVAELADECSASVIDLSGGITTLCRDGALALAATRAGVALATSQGSPVPGSASTLGRRMASSPRLAFSLRGG